MKKFMFVNRKPPYGTIYALEGLEVVLIAATFDQDVSLVFIDDGVYELARGQDTKAIGIKNHSKTYRALDGYDVEKLYVERESPMSSSERGWPCSPTSTHCSPRARAGSMTRGSAMPNSLMRCTLSSSARAA